MKKFILLFATGLGAGSVPKIPGTAGTVVGLLLYLLLKGLPPVAYLLTLLAFVFLSVWISDLAAVTLDKKDPSSIVIDEIAGFLVTVSFVPFSWTLLIAGFLLFRLFDIWKPFPCRLIQDRWRGGWGIVGDDVMAGIYANLVLLALTHL